MYCIYGNDAAKYSFTVGNVSSGENNCVGNAIQMVCWQERLPPRIFKFRQQGDRFAHRRTFCARI